MSEILIIFLAFIISSFSWFFIHRFSVMAQLENQMEVLLFHEKIQADYCYSVIDSYSSWHARPCESCQKIHHIWHYNSLSTLINPCSKRNKILLLLSEIFMAGVLYLYFVKFSWSYEYVILIILSVFFLIITVIDFKYFIIPDELNYLGLSLGLSIHGALSLAHYFGKLPSNSFFQLSNQEYGLVFSASGVLLSAGILFAIAYTVSKILNKEAMGGGDIKLIAFIGAFLGYKVTLMSLAISSLLGSTFGLLALINSRYLQKNQGYTTIAFGPYIIFATLIVLYFGENNLIQWYMDFSQYWVGEYSLHQMQF